MLESSIETRVGWAVPIFNMEPFAQRDFQRENWALKIKHRTDTARFEREKLAWFKHGFFHRVHFKNRVNESNLQAANDRLREKSIDSSFETSIETSVV